MQDVWLNGLSGGLFANLLPTIRYAEAHFLINDSLQVVGIAVIGGLGSVTGAMLGAVWVEGLPAFWPDNEVCPEGHVTLLVLGRDAPWGPVRLSVPDGGSLSVGDGNNSIDIGINATLSGGLVGGLVSYLIGRSGGPASARATDSAPELAGV